MTGRVKWECCCGAEKMFAGSRVVFCPHDANRCVYPVPVLWRVSKTDLSLTCVASTGSMVVMTHDTVPASLAEALQALSTSANGGMAPAVARAGATDLYPVAEARRSWFGTVGGAVIDLGQIPGLADIKVGHGEIALGACVTWSALAGADLAPAFDGLRAAARQVGGQQIQNRGTLGGNICNASPAADGVPPLLALDAEVELASLTGLRRLSLAAFIHGNRRTALRPDELMTRIIVPQPAPHERSIFLKLGARSYLVISIASVAVNLRMDGAGRISGGRIALGACSAVPLRLGRIERDMVGLRPDEVSITLSAEDGVIPMDDVRASAAYRLHAAETLVRRAILDCASAMRNVA